MKVYTRKGDSGQTSIWVGRRMSKDHEPVEAIGAADDKVGTQLTSSPSPCMCRGSSHLPRVPSARVKTGPQSGFIYCQRCGAAGLAAHGRHVIPGTNGGQPLVMKFKAWTRSLCRSPGDRPSHPPSPRLDGPQAVLQ